MFNPEQKVLVGATAVGVPARFAGVIWQYIKNLDRYPLGNTGSSEYS